MYEIKVLGSKDFDKLPYDGISDSLGIADVKKNRVFVRNTGIHEINRYLINHEIDHLVEEHATDEDANGIRHKKGPKIFKDIFLPAITGGISSAIGGGGEGGGSSLLSGITSLFGGGGEKASGSYQPEQQQNSGSYSPSGGFGSPMNLFGNQQMGSASGSLPQAVSGSYQPSITTGLGAESNESGIPPEVLAKLKSGNYQGRLTF